MAFDAPALDAPLIGALNHLLAAEPWARERLAPFAGEVLEIRAAALPRLRCAVAADGRLGADAGGAEPTLVITVRPGALAAALQGEERLLRAIDVAGNTEFAAAVMFLFRHLRWDVEEDVARLVGDVAAHRLVGLAKDALAWHADAARRVAAGLVEYALEERQLLVRRADLDALGEAHARLRDGLERLEKRIERLAGGA
jgi:ubiquinone biosynthesis protein UbiJ